MSCCWPPSGNNNNNNRNRCDICTGRSWTRNKLNLPATFAHSKLESVPNPFVFLPGPVPLRRNDQSVKILPDSRTNIPKSFDVCMMQGKRCCTFFPTFGQTVGYIQKHRMFHMFHCYDPAPPNEFPEAWLQICHHRSFVVNNMYSNIWTPMLFTGLQPAN